MQTLENAHLSENGEALQTAKMSQMNGGTQGESNARWYAVQTYPRHEKRVREDLESRAIENFLPLYETVNRWKNGCKVRVELPLFPGYIFVKIDPRERFKVLSLPGTVSIIGSPTGPWAIPEGEIVTLRASMGAGTFEPHTYITVGEKVRIKVGPLAGMTGFMTRHGGGVRVVISVELIQKSAAVEIDANDLEVIEEAYLT